MRISDNMQVRRVISYGVSALALASWLASASTSGVRPPAAPLAPLKPVAIDRSVEALQTEVGRLHDRLAPTAAPTRSRDLFRFSARVPRPPVRADVVSTPPDDAVPRPLAVSVFTLIGIAEEPSPGGTLRTAIVSGLGDVFLAKSGDTIAGHYRIDRVAADGVQFTDTSTFSTITLALR